VRKLLDGRAAEADRLIPVCDGMEPIVAPPRVRAARLFLTSLIPDAAATRCSNSIRRTTKWTPSKASEVRKLLDELGIRRCPRTTVARSAACIRRIELNARNTRIL
jgi:hypothetical protein